MKNIYNPALSFLRSGLFLQPLLLLLPTIIKPTTNTPIMSAMFENVSLSTMEIIKNNGYTVEVHNVVTEDGYILELHRIPRSKSGQKPTRNHPIYLHHGIFGSSADWVLGGANISLPMNLADDGYDVWMANCRGNTYSRKHVTMTYKQRAFWDFSLNELGKYDLPASIDYILINTKVQQLHYVGYSMGTCVFYIMASERPEYQPKIRSQVSLAPVAYLYHTRSFLRYIAYYANIMNIIIQNMSNGMLMPQTRMQTFLASTVCRERLTQKLLCEKCFIFSVCGSDPYTFDSNLIPIIMGHFPAGTSSKLTTHFAQFILKDTFGQYDYGSKLNMKHYNSTVPPVYNLESIQVPITLIYGENDILADVEDVMKLKDQLPKLMDAFPVNNSYCNHVDFLWGLNVYKEVNEPVKRILDTTDNLDWVYTGPNPTMTNEIANVGGDHGKVDITAARRAQETTGILNFVPGLDYFAEHLEAIIAEAMPRFVDEKDVAVFEQERDMQKALFRNLIEYVKSTKIEYGQLLEDFTDEIYNWTDREIADAGFTVKAHAKKITFLINGKVKQAGKSMADGVVRAEGVMVGGVGRAESFVVGGVVKAEQSVVGSMVKAETFVNYGLNRADRTVGNAFNTTLRRLNRVFWFLK